MKAIRFYAKEDVRVEDVPAPNSLGDSQVLIKPLTCGICGTDLHEFAGGPIVTPATQHKFTGAVLPQILGHEFSAEVVDIGRDVKRVRKGDRISIQPLVMPLDDYYSRRGLNHLSPSMGCIGLSWAWGGMGELAVINDYNANPDSRQCHRRTGRDGRADRCRALWSRPREGDRRKHGACDRRRADRRAGRADLQRDGRIEDLRQRAERQSSQHDRKPWRCDRRARSEVGQRHRLYPRQYRGGRWRRFRDRVLRNRSGA